MDLSYYGHGKLLLTGEYFVLDGAEALALPTNFGQSFIVKTGKKSGVLHWKSYNDAGEIWLECSFLKKSLSLLGDKRNESGLLLEKILSATKRLNPHFLEDDHPISVETYLDFPRLWGLGSSSTLIYCIAKWAKVNAFSLLAETFGGSGYDLACAGAKGSIVFQLEAGRANWQSVDYLPDFSDRLFFVYLGKKQNSRDAIGYYREKVASNLSLISQVTNLTYEFLEAKSISILEDVIRRHERLVGSMLGLTRAKDLFFSDFNGEVKSLGAWGGDFVLVTNPFVEESDLRQYFSAKGFTTVLSYGEMVL